MCLIVVYLNKKPWIKIKHADDLSTEHKHSLRIHVEHCIAYHRKQQQNSDKLSLFIYTEHCAHRKQRNGRKQIVQKRCVCVSNTNERSLTEKPITELSVRALNIHTHYKE